MKLKEKLSFEARKRYIEDVSLEYEIPFGDGYLAGFEKAREMAVEELKGGTGDAAGLDEVIATLGEEEVPDESRT